MSIPIRLRPAWPSFWVCVAMFGLLGVLAFGASPARAAEPWWHLTLHTQNALQPGEEGKIFFAADNLGDATVNAATNPVTITGQLPAGFKASAIAAKAAGGENGIASPVCSLAASSFTCVFSEAPPLLPVLPPYYALEVIVTGAFEEGAPGGVDQTSISGGGAVAASIERSITPGVGPLPFGVQDNRLAFEEEGGGPATQAGSHPFQVTDTLALNQDLINVSTRSFGEPKEGNPVELAKDINVKLPPGFVGNPTPFPRCSDGQFLTDIGGAQNACPASTAVGVAQVRVRDLSGGERIITVPVFNLEPSFGEPARFGFYVAIAKVPVYLDTSVRSGAGEDYGITVSSLHTSQTASFLSSEVTFWGVPGDQVHNISRGWGCQYASLGFKFAEPCIPPVAESHPPALLTLPTSCSGALSSSTEIDAWPEPEKFLTVPASPMQSMEGCNRLKFSPTISAEPTPRRRPDRRRRDRAIPAEQGRRDAARRPHDQSLRGCRARWLHPG
jgi:hypothetical protein